MEIRVGQFVIVNPRFVEAFKLFHFLLTGEKIEFSGRGKVVAVDPSNEEIRQYKELNPNADGTNSVIFYDKEAGRHFIIDKCKIETVLQAV
jgi:hypothetical protein